MQKALIFVGFAPPIDAIDESKTKSELSTAAGRSGREPGLFEESLLIIL